ncbi:MAG: amidohydrolase [Clostridium sp.]|nr:amidohydrolase [Clostridium sp.]MCM1534686.1 amidohydrolase [Clostridium sp.]
MIRFYNGKVLTMNREMEIHEDYEVWVNGTQIVYVGPKPFGADEKGGLKKADIRFSDFDGSFEREIDLKGNLLMPGFKNAHTHSPMTFLRSYADDLPLQEWLHQQVFPMEAKLTPDMIYHFTRLAVLEYLTSGITASFDMYVEPEANANANVDMGFRTVLCGTLNDFKDTVSELEGFYQRYNQYHPLIRYQLGFHAEYTTSEPLLRDLAALANQLQAPVYTHLSETKQEVEQCWQRYGKSPVELLSDLGIWNYGGGGFHCVHVSDRDMDILKERGIYAVTNPASNAKLASGIAPIISMQEKGIPLAIGTDGPASNNCLDMFREMFLVTALAKLREADASACPAEQVLQMGTVGGARAMGLTDCDCIAEEKQADLIVIDLHQPNMQPEHNIIKNLVYSGSKQNVKLTMIAGRILYEDGQFYVGEEPERIYEKVRAYTSILGN